MSTRKNITGFIHFLIVIKTLNPFKSEIILEPLILFKLQLPNLESCNGLETKCCFLETLYIAWKFLT